MYNLHMTQQMTLEDQKERAYQLQRPMSLRIGPRQKEFEVLPTAVRFNIFLFEKGMRKAFQIDGMWASDLKWEFVNLKRSLLHFLAKHCRVSDLVCIDYDYGILVTSERAIQEVLPTFDRRTLPRDVMTHAGTLLGIPCTIVGNRSKWQKNPHTIAIIVDDVSLKQYMCTEQEYQLTFEIAMREYIQLKTEADEYNRFFTDDPIHTVSLELRGKTRAGIEDFKYEMRSLERDKEQNRILMFTAGDVRRLAI